MMCNTFSYTEKIISDQSWGYPFMVGIESSDSLFIYPSIYLFNKYLLNIFYGPGTVLGPYVNETCYWKVSRNSNWWYGGKKTLNK